MDPDAFDRLVREHRKMVYSIAMTYCRDAHTADDIAQETFIRAHRAFNGLADHSKLKTWLYTLTRNASIDHLRRKKRRRELINSVGERARMDHTGRSHSEEVDRLLNIIETLSDAYQRMILLRYVEDLSYKEIAGVLGMQVSAVGEKLSRIRNLIADRMNLGSAAS